MVSRAFAHLGGGSEGQHRGWLSFREFLPRSAYSGTVEISLYVSEESRRRGVAREMLQEAIARAAPTKGAFAGGVNFCR
jgi:L-amino acid N-acyltransferase YncA